MANTVEYYLSKGFDRKAAEYFAGGKKKIVGVVANRDFTLTIRFDNGEKRLYDMRPLLKKGTVFEPFTDMENFSRVYVDDTHSIAWDIDPNVDSNKVWNNKVDLCADISRISLFMYLLFLSVLNYMRLKLGIKMPGLLLLPGSGGTI